MASGSKDAGKSGSDSGKTEITWWGYYYEAKSSSFDYDNLNETLQYEYFKDNEDLLAKKWENYTRFKKELYGL